MAPGFPLLSLTRKTTDMPCAFELVDGYGGFDPPPMPLWRQAIGGPGWRELPMGFDNEVRAAVTEAMEDFVKHLAPDEKDRLPIARATDALVQEVLVALEAFGVLKPEGLFGGIWETDQQRLNRVMERIRDPKEPDHVIPESQYKRLMREEGLGYLIGRFRKKYDVDRYDTMPPEYCEEMAGKYPEHASEYSVNREDHCVRAEAEIPQPASGEELQPQTDGEQREPGRPTQ